MMQKHERHCIEAAKQVLEPGYLVDHHHNGNSKMVIAAQHQSGGRVHYYTVPSSPRDGHDAACHVKQWAKRVLKGTD